MRIQSIKCNPMFDIGDGEVILSLTDIEVGTITKALEEYIKARPEAASMPHIGNTADRWSKLRFLMNEGIFEGGE